MRTKFRAGCGPDLQGRRCAVVFGRFGRDVRLPRATGFRVSCSFIAVCILSGGGLSWRVMSELTLSTLGRDELTRCLSCFITIAAHALRFDFEKH